MSHRTLFYMLKELERTMPSRSVIWARQSNQSSRPFLFDNSYPLKLRIPSHGLLVQLPFAPSTTAITLPALATFNQIKPNQKVKYAIEL